MMMSLGWELLESDLLGVIQRIFVGDGELL